MLFKILPPPSNRMCNMYTLYSFNELHSALDGLGPTISRMRESIYSILAAILHLGNVNFKTDNLGSAQINDDDGSHDALEFAAKLLAINRKYLERVILERTVAVADNLISYVFSMRCIFQSRFKNYCCFVLIAYHTMTHWQQEQEIRWSNLFIVR